MFFVVCAFLVSACGPMNAKPPSAGGGEEPASADGTADVSKDLSAKKEFHIYYKLLTPLSDGQLAAGDSQIKVRVVHAADYSPLTSTESINVQYFKTREPGDTTTPNQGMLTATLTPQPDGSTIADLHFAKSPKNVTILISVSDSSDPTQNDQKYVFYDQASQ